MIVEHAVTDTVVIIPVIPVKTVTPVVRIAGLVRYAVTIYVNTKVARTATPALVIVEPVITDTVATIPATTAKTVTHAVKIVVIVDIVEMATVVIWRHVSPVMPIVVTAPFAATVCVTMGKHATPVVRIAVHVRSAAMVSVMEGNPVCTARSIVATVFHLRHQRSRL